MVTCAQCGVEFAARKSTARFCSPACRLKAHRAKGGAEGGPVAPVRAPIVSLVSRRRAAEVIDRARVSCIEDAVVVELGDDVASTLGQQALSLARRMDSGQDPSGAAVAALSKQLTDVMARALSAKVDTNVDDPITLLRLQALEIRRRHASAS